MMELSHSHKQSIRYPLSAIRSRRGQLLVEALLAIALIAIVSAFIGGLTAVTLQSNSAGGKRSVGLQLSREALEVARTIRDSNEATVRGWNKIYLPPDGSAASPNSSKGNGNPYYVRLSGAPATWSLSTNTADRDIAKDGITFERSVIIQNICRTAPNGGGDIGGVHTDTSGTCPGGQYNDPSTQKITVTVTAQGMATVTISEYLTRAKNEVKVWTNQSDFSGGICTQTRVTGTGEVELGSGGC